MIGVTDKHNNEKDEVDPAESVHESINCKNLEAASGFEPLHRGFADLSLNHLGTPPQNNS